MLMDFMLEFDNLFFKIVIQRDNIYKGRVIKYNVYNGKIFIYKNM